MHGEEQIRQLRSGEVGDAGYDPTRGHEDVTGQERLEVHEADGVRGLVEYLEASEGGCGQREEGRTCEVIMNFPKNMGAVEAGGDGGIVEDTVG